MNKGLIARPGSIPEDFLVYNLRLSGALKPGGADSGLPKLYAADAGCQGDTMTVPEYLRIPDDLLEFDDDHVYRYQGELFTGIAFEEDPDLGLSEVSYREGAQDGWARDWNPAGQLIGETHWFLNTAHGPSRTFNEHGSLILDKLNAYGRLVSSVNRDASGRIVEESHVAPGSEAFIDIERSRERLKWPEPDSFN